MSPDLASPQGVSPGALRTITLCLFYLAAAFPVPAGQGGPDAFGYTWFDGYDGCGSGVAPHVAPLEFIAPTEAIGPIQLGFTMPYFGEPVTEAWISPTGFLAFSDQGPDGASAVPHAMADPRPPNHIVAPYWTSSPAQRVLVETFPDRLEVTWEWRGLDPLEPVRLTLHRSGDLRISSGLARPDTLPGTVGYEDRTGSLGHGLQFEGMPTDPEFPGMSPQQTACIVAPPRLDCSAPLSLACGDSAMGSLPDTLDPQVAVWSCSDVARPGNERIIRVDVDRLQRLTLELDAPSLDVAHLAGLEGCEERACVAVRPQRLTVPFLPPGSHWFAVDRTLPGGGDAFRVTATCDDLPRIGCPAVVVADTLADGTSGRDRHACADLLLDGPEIAYVLERPESGHVAVRVDPPTAWVLIHDEAGNCLTAGLGGAALFDAPAGDIVVMVDTPAGIAGAFTLSVDCGTLLDCAGAPSLQCGDTVNGDTRGLPPGSALHGCGPKILDGGAAIYRFENPSDQAVGARLLTAQPGQRLLLVTDCDEGRCVGGGPAGTCALLPAGTSHVVVSGPAGSEGPFSLILDCATAPSGGPDLAVTGIDLFAVSAPCNGLEIAGDARVSVLSVGDAPSPAPFEVVVFEDRDASGDYEPGGSDVELGRAIVATDIAAGESLVVNVGVAGRLLFRGHPISAKVDPESLTGDVDTSNNTLEPTAHRDGCAAVAHELSAVIEWEWSGSPSHPDLRQVVTSPMVADLTGDGIPEVIFSASGSESCQIEGALLQAISGADGSQVWVADQAGARVACNSTPAIADLTGDGRLEIVAPSHDEPDRLHAFDASGELLWTSAALLGAPVAIGGMVSIGDIDGDAQPEIAWGGFVFRADGTLFWDVESGGTHGGGIWGPMSVIVDLDSDGVSEVVAGSTAYRWNAATGRGEILWQNATAPDWHVAVANFDDDPEPEIILSGEYELHLLDGDGVTLWSVDVPRLGPNCANDPYLGLGLPTVADYDGDGQPEIGLPGPSWLIVYEGDGTELWRAAIDDCSSGRLSSTAFDLDGDGFLEAIVQDETALRILAGVDGTELLTLPANSLTGNETAIVADVDADGRAEILSPANDGPSGPGGFVGIRVWGGAVDGWANARRIWNQHGYHGTNVLDDGTVPAATASACLPPSTGAWNTFRVQQPVSEGPMPTPDLTLAILEAGSGGPRGCDALVHVRLRVGNAGDASTGIAFDVSFYDGDPAAGGLLLATETLDPLAQRAFVDLEASLAFPRVGAATLFAVVNDEGDGTRSIEECRRDNDACSVMVNVVEPGPVVVPNDVGNVLLVTDHGDAHAADIEALLSWTADEGSPRDVAEHFHVRRGEGPFLAPIAGIEPHAATELVETTPAAPSLPHVYFYRVFSADGCESESTN